MDIQYRDDKTAGPGHGMLIFSEALLPEGPWKVSIQRGSDKKYLTGMQPNPWVGEAFFIPLQGQALPDSSIELSLSPKEVNELDQQEQYLVRIKGADDEPLKGRLRISEITYSPSGNLGNTPEAQEAPRQTAAPTQPAQEQPAQEPIQESQPASETTTQPEPIDMPAAPLQSRKLWRWALLGILVLACIAWYLFDPRNKDTSPQPAPSVQKQDAQPSGEQSAEEQVRAFFKGERISPQEAYALANRLPVNTKTDQDAVYRLYYFAAENGDALAMLAYGKCLDPSQPQWGTIEKNAPAAWAAYEKAPNREKAAELMDKLKDWLQEQASKGNAQAKTWLDEIGR